MFRDSGAVMRLKNTNGLRLQEDLFARDLKRLSRAGIAGVDTEMTGINPNRDLLCLVQICDSQGFVNIIRTADWGNTLNLKTFFSSEEFLKIFHFALADCSFILMKLGIEVKNVDNGQRIVMTRVGGLVGDVETVIDCKLKTVKYGGLNMNYYGSFPNFLAGANNISIKFGDIPCVSFEAAGLDTDDETIYGGNTARAAQSFMTPYYDATFQGIELYLRKVNTPTNPLVVRIETDDNGKPSGNLAHADAYFYIGMASLSTSFAFVREHTVPNTKFYLQPNTLYWIVASLADVGGSNVVEWRGNKGLDATYKNGNAMIYDGSWINSANQDLGFRLLFGGKFESKTYHQTVKYYKRFL